MKQIVVTLLILIGLLFSGTKGSDDFLETYKENKTIEARYVNPPNNDVMILSSSIVVGEYPNKWWCADVRNWGTGNGNVVQAWYCGWSTQYSGTFTQNNQKWTAVQMSDGNYQLVNKNSGKCMDVSDYPNPPSKALGQGIQQWDCAGSPNQRWQYVQTPTYAQYKNVWSGYCLGICTGCPVATQLTQISCSSAWSKWAL